MKAKLLNEQMGVLNDGGTRARVCIAPNGLRIAVAAENLEMVPDTEPFSEPKLDERLDAQTDETSEVESAEPIDDDHDPKWEDSRDESSDPQPDDDFDEELPAPQGSCDGEACESCQ